MKQRLVKSLFVPTVCLKERPSRRWTDAALSISSVWARPCCGSSGTRTDRCCTWWGPGAWWPRTWWRLATLASFQNKWGAAATGCHIAIFKGWLSENCLGCFNILLMLLWKLKWSQCGKIICLLISYSGNINIYEGIFNSSSFVNEILSTV